MKPSKEYCPDGPIFEGNRQANEASIEMGTLEGFPYPPAMVRAQHCGAAPHASVDPQQRRGFAELVALRVDDVELVGAGVVGTAIDVAVPAALVIVAPAVNVVVPAGANQTAFDASPLLRMPMLLVPPRPSALAGNT